MSTWTGPAKPLTFSAFFEWLKDHANCVLAAGWAGTSLFDDEALHWAFFEEEERRAVIQLLKGKSLLAEIVMDGRLVDEVEVVPDPENPQSGHYLAELLTSARDGRETRGYVLLAHGVEETRSHPALRH